MSNWVASLTYYALKFLAKRQQTRAPNMKTIAFLYPQAIEQQDALIDIELPTYAPLSHLSKGNTKYYGGMP